MQISICCNQATFIHFSIFKVEKCPSYNLITVILIYNHLLHSSRWGGHEVQSSWFNFSCHVVDVNCQSCPTTCQLSSYRNQAILMIMYEMFRMHWVLFCPGLDCTVSPFPAGRLTLAHAAKLQCSRLDIMHFVVIWFVTGYVLREMPSYLCLGNLLL